MIHRSCVRARSARRSAWQFTHSSSTSPTRSFIKITYLNFFGTHNCLHRAMIHLHRTPHVRDLLSTFEEKSSQLRRTFTKGVKFEYAKGSYVRPLRVRQRKQFNSYNIIWLARQQRRKQQLTTMREYAYSHLSSRNVSRPRAMEFEEKIDSTTTSNLIKHRYDGPGYDLGQRFQYNNLPTLVENLQILFFVAMIALSSGAQLPAEPEKKIEEPKSPQPAETEQLNRQKRGFVYSAYAAPYTYPVAAAYAAPVAYTYGASYPYGYSAYAPYYSYPTFWRCERRYFLTAYPPEAGNNVRRQIVNFKGFAQNQQEAPVHRTRELPRPVKTREYSQNNKSKAIRVASFSFDEFRWASLKKISQIPSHRTIYTRDQTSRNRRNEFCADAAATLAARRIDNKPATTHCERVCQPYIFKRVSTTEADDSFESFPALLLCQHAFYHGMCTRRSRANSRRINHQMCTTMCGYKRCARITESWFRYTTLRRRTSTRVNCLQNA
ncbi:unnamed protein product [Trichogramma brassicae]|uniref:Uncharacterized protein n=1 Tax=Trichogramma brassicae TaxID=86971 RepID=A0A6H5I7S3_9HYME|nr:unnamed protein product [Trichogramma brassicae]